MKDKNKEIVRALFEQYINEGRLADFKDLVATDYLQEYTNTIQSVRSGFPDLRFEVKELIAEDDNVVVRWQWTGTHQGVFKGHPATGKKAVTDGMSIYRMKNGKLVEVVAIVDRLMPLQAIGVVKL